MTDKKEKQKRFDLMKKIKDEIVDLKDSPLYKERIVNKVFPVIGEGSHFAEIMFIGEAPGKNEALTGKPFCGASGRILDELLKHVDLNREDVYVTNVVKDRPPGNRDPLPSEIEIYAPFLDRQIDIIQPKVIATLGRFSMVYIMKKFDLDFEIEPISKIHGKAFDAKASYGEVNLHTYSGITFRGQSEISNEKQDFVTKTSSVNKNKGNADHNARIGVGVKIIPLYHPAVAVYNANSKDELKKDFEVLKEYASNRK